MSRWGKRPITDITQADVLVVTDALKKRGKPAMAHAQFRYIRAFFGWATGRYGLERSPVAGVCPKRDIGKRRIRQRVLNDEEIFCFWRAARRTNYPFGPMYQLLALSGLRLTEVSDARWREFDLKAHLWTIPAERMKAAEAHEVPLTDDMLAILSALPRFHKGDFLFSTTFGVKPISGFSKAKARLDRRMLLTWRALGDDRRGKAFEPFVIHDIRRVVRTNLARLLVPDLIAELLIGHRPGGLHRVYVRHTYRAEKLQALERWGQHLRAIVEPAPDNVVALRRDGRGEAR